MSRVIVNGKSFETFIPEDEILLQVKKLADRMSRELEGKNPLLIAVLNGSFIFAADLMRMMTIPCEISFVRMASYEGTESTGKVTELLGVQEDIAGRTVVIVEDIIDTGLTMKQMVAMLEERRPESIHICSLLVKPDKLQVDLDIEYKAFVIPNDFILGYGLDYDQQGRNLRDIYTLLEE